MTVKRPRVAEVTTMSVKELKKLPSCCAWDGCKAHFYGDETPNDWRSLLVFHKQKHGRKLDFLDPKIKWNRDASLCLKHAAELDGLLKPLLMSLEDLVDSAAHKMGLN